MSSITLEQYEQLKPALEVELNGRKIIYNTPNSNTAWRVQSLFTKEPDTIEWINAFEEGSTLLDIGANVGMYTIFAAGMRGCHVHAFEPESQNFALLNRNIFSNRLGDLVTAYPVALSDSFGFDKLHLSNFVAGGSCHNFCETVDFDGRPFKPRFSQGCIAVSVDELIEKHALPVPDYIKVDVDGIEHKVINGARRLLESGKVRSVLIEINTNREDHRGTVQLMESLGYRWSAEQVDKAQRTEGAFKGVGNYIFVRA